MAEGNYLISTAFAGPLSTVMEHLGVPVDTLQSSPIGILLFEALKQLSVGNDRRRELARYFIRAGAHPGVLVSSSLRMWEGTPMGNGSVDVRAATGWPDWAEDRYPDERWTEYSFGRW
jgi:hypothetical protein